MVVDTVGDFAFCSTAPSIVLSKPPDAAVHSSAHSLPAGNPCGPYTPKPHQMPTQSSEFAASAFHATHASMHAVKVGVKRTYKKLLKCHSVLQRTSNVASPDWYVVEFKSVHWVLLFCNEPAGNDEGSKKLLPLVFCFLPMEFTIRIHDHVMARLHLRTPTVSEDERKKITNRKRDSDVLSDQAELA
jgi:hypothetical protein